ncbi:WXG100 family type VII secretion target [Nocardia sp. NPDC058519]|uniref:WXG100 family type VII secretion target n=1 Tax=unclassified Nocardia TaxID=2637762 RepID=UPI0036522473
MTSTPPTVSQIKSWSFAALISQADEWATSTQLITAEHSTIATQMSDSPGFWRGPAGDAMRTKSDEARTSLSKVIGAFEDSHKATRSIAQILGFAKAAAVDAISAAEELKLKVSEDGSVDYSEELMAWLIHEEKQNLTTALAIAKKLARQHEISVKTSLINAAQAAEDSRTAINNIFAEVPIPPNAELDEIKFSQQTGVDPAGMTKWPDGALAASLEGLEVISLGKIDVEPKEVTQSEADMLNSLSLADQARFLVLSDEASKAAEEAYPNIPTQDSHVDAYRHTYWNAMLTQEFGPEWTQEYATKHEGRADNAAVREAMDLHNNEVGRRIGAENPQASSAEMRELVQQAVDGGDTVLIDQDQNLAWTRDVKPGASVVSSDFDQNPIFLPGTPLPNSQPSPDRPNS